MKNYQIDSMMSFGNFLINVKNYENNVFDYNSKDFYVLDGFI